MESEASNTALRDCPFQDGICKATECMLWITTRKEEEEYEYGHCVFVKIYTNPNQPRVVRRMPMD